MRWAAALADEGDLPAGAADPLHRVDTVGQRRSGRAAEPPAGAGGGRRRERISPRLAPAAEQKSRRELVSPEWVIDRAGRFEDPR